MKQATISNPNTSQAAKEHSRQIIQELEGQGADAHLSRQPRVDDEEEEVPIIETNPPSALGDNTQHESAPGGTEPAVDDSSFVGKDPNRVLGGFKATLHSECFLDVRS